MKVFWGLERIGTTQCNLFQILSLLSWKAWKGFLPTASSKSHRSTCVCIHMSANKALELILSVMGTLFGMLASFAFCLVTHNLSYILPFLSGLENLDTFVCRLHPFLFFGNLLPHGLVRFHRPLWCASKLLLTTTWGVQNDNWILGVCTQFYTRTIILTKFWVGCVVNSKIVVCAFCLL